MHGLSQGNDRHRGDQGDQGDDDGVGLQGDQTGEDQALAGGGQGPEAPHRVSRIGQGQDQPEEENEAVHHQQPDHHLAKGKTRQGQAEEGQGQPGQGRGIGGGGGR
jgi:hypothetical protein